MCTVRSYFHSWESHAFQYQSVDMKAVLKCFGVVNCNIAAIGGNIEKIKGMAYSVLYKY